MDRREALQHASRAQIQLVMGVGLLAIAARNTFKVVKYLQGVLPRDRIISVADQAPKETHAALEEMVETYSEQVN